MTITYIIPAVVQSVDHRRKLVRTYRNRKTPDDPNPEVLNEYEDLGWYLHLRGSHESLYLGHIEPNLVAGDEVEIIIRKKEWHP